MPCRSWATEHTSGCLGSFDHLYNAPRHTNTNTAAMIPGHRSHSAARDHLEFDRLDWRALLDAIGLHAGIERQCPCLARLHLGHDFLETLPLVRVPEGMRARPSPGARSSVDAPRCRPAALVGHADHDAGIVPDRDRLVVSETISTRSAGGLPMSTPSSLLRWSAGVAQASRGTFPR